MLLWGQILRRGECSEAITNHRRSLAGITDKAEHPLYMGLSETDTITKSQKGIAVPTKGFAEVAKSAVTINR